MRTFFRPPVSRKAIKNKHRRIYKSGIDVEHAVSLVADRPKTRLPEPFGDMTLASTAMPTVKFLTSKIEDAWVAELAKKTRQMPEQ